MVGLHMTVHMKKREWVEEEAARYVPVRIHFTEDCTLQDRDENPEWHAEIKLDDAGTPAPRS